MVTKNSGEQFYLFAILAAWLIRKCGKLFETPQEYDDPNSTIEKILSEVKDLVRIVDFKSIQKLTFVKLAMLYAIFTRVGCKKCAGISKLPISRNSLGNYRPRCYCYCISNF